MPYKAARDKLFLPVFAKLHPKGHFPTAGLLVMGVINALTAVTVLVQSVAQIAALIVLRRRQPNLARPYRMWLFPVPLIVAFVGWVYLYFSTDWLSIGLSIAWVAVGVVAFLIWARAEQVWPFGSKEIKEEFLTTSTSGA